MQVTVQQLAAHYAKLCTLAELGNRLDLEIDALLIQKEHTAKVGGGGVAAATEAALRLEIRALRAAIQLAKA